MDNNKKSMETIVNLCKGRGFVYPGSEIYGGLANTWDYGPLGSQMKMNLKAEWWKFFVQKRPDMVGLDSAIFMNPKVWEASGHVANFSDPLVDCKSCKSRHRADHIIEAQADIDVEGKTTQEIDEIIASKGVKCPKCGEKNFTPVRKFNLLFETLLGVIEGDKSSIYLRGETAQGIFVNFKNILQSSRKKLPFGVCQIGKAFRNEITPGNFTFRTLEFEQAEIEYFFNPAKQDWEKLFDELLGSMKEFLTTRLGLKDENLRELEHAKEKLSHYSKKTVDFEFNYPFGFKELTGCAYRTDFDLATHSKASGQDLTYYEQEANEHVAPHVIEPSFGVDRMILATIVDAYDEEGEGEEKRTVLRFNKYMAPYQVAVLPLSKKDELSVVAQPIFNTLLDSFRVDYDETQSIGKRYRRQDEIGTLYCITVDFDSINDHMVTVRERDSMKQERVPIAELVSYLGKLLA
ncbi:glycine--tRNA ligase [Candidatus Falkowbacteria bacterium]|nr:glycine--tRNA ligase [Candidatus Falkowbacteria bacterium]